MKKRLVAMAIASTMCASYAVHARTGDLSVISGKEEIEFSASVDSQCGLAIEKDKGALAFGDHYLNDAAEIRVIDNRQDGQVLVQLSKLDYDEDDFPENVDYGWFYFKLTGAAEQEGNANEWFNGKTFSRSELGEDNTLQIRARISLDEEAAVATDHAAVETEWVTFCA
ncbi:hypothetical protein JCM19240_5562 [Vibrio maritimus]|uniref:Uncharacterized protein n=1 Tax=Vibrio maritimus TaxID=990268 RepID=A0A090SWS4_9VIBR|nr:hypothetical protein JCM19240_5562 [Vibrio maritimus]